MTKEDIVKAADDYIGHPREEDEGLDIYITRKAFMDGAEWACKMTEERCGKIEDKIQEILAEHHECRWMDSSELENCLRMIATEQRQIDIDKSWQWMVDWVFENAPHEVFDELMSSREEYIKAIEE